MTYLSIVSWLGLTEEVVHDAGRSVLAGLDRRKRVSDTK